MATKSKTFKVIGDGRFPLDMLRYDACYPVTTNDALAIGTQFPFRKPTESRTVLLRTNAENAPTIGRWESFGWRVIV
jgi:hypothetical protein